MITLRQDPAYRAKMQAAQQRRWEREAKIFIDELSYEEKSYLLRLGVLNSSFRLTCKNRPIKKIKGYLNGYKASEAAARGGEMMKAYSAFSREVGPEEGAILVIAQSAKEAKPLAWKSGACWNVDGWTDLAIRLIRDDTHVLPLADQESLKLGEPHIIDSPFGCDKCGFWGAGITEDKLCGNCNEPPGDTLVKLLAAAKGAINNR